MPETKFGSSKDLLAIIEMALHPILNQLKRIILEIDPNAVEVARLGCRAATVG